MVVRAREIKSAALGHRLSGTPATFLSKSQRRTRKIVLSKKRSSRRQRQRSIRTHCSIGLHSKWQVGQSRNDQTRLRMELRQIFKRQNIYSGREKSTSGKERIVGRCASTSPVEMAKRKKESLEKIKSVDK